MGSAAAPSFMGALYMYILQDESLCHATTRHIPNYHPLPTDVIRALQLLAFAARPRVHYIVKCVNTNATNLMLASLAISPCTPIAFYTIRTHNWPTCESDDVCNYT